MKLKYLFFVNVQKDGDGRWVGFLGYQSGHALELAYHGAVEAEHERHACNQLFEKFNINHPRDYRNRSMSVGDVIVIDHRKAYACESVGWKETPVPDERESGVLIVDHETWEEMTDEEKGEFYHNLSLSKKTFVVDGVVSEYDSMLGPTTTGFGGSSEQPKSHSE
jgi:YodL-like protein